MGTWDSAPWDNDQACDWYGTMFDATELAAYVEATLRLDVEQNYLRIRAAASLLVFLGRPYVWPIDDLERHLALAIEKLEAMALLPHADEILHVDEVRAEAQLLRSRMKRPRERAVDPALAETWASLR